jgi:amino acid transporter
MATARRMKAPLEQPVEKELKLVFVAAVGPQAPAVTVLAFVPMLLTSIGYRELNKADPDCGTTFTWATRAFGPRSGWAGWAIIVADVLVLASLAQVAGQYVFFLFNADGIGANPASGWTPKAKQRRAPEGVCRADMKPAINPIQELEDLTRWPKPYSATSAGQIPACSQRCVAFSNKYATWNPS